MTSAQPIREATGDAGEDPAIEAMRARLSGTNINEKTLLATDYLNHFNEFVMLLEMVGDMPDMLDEVGEWEPKSYREHFADSSFSDRDLAIEAYAIAPAFWRERFDQTVTRIDTEIANIFASVVEAVMADDNERLSVLVADGAHTVRSLIDIASAIINGFDGVSSQSEVDRLLER